MRTRAVVVAENMKAGRLELRSPGIVFHAVRVLATPISGMGKLMLQAYLPRARPLDCMLFCCYEQVQLAPEL